MAKKSCDCWSEKEAGLRKLGYKIADVCSTFQVSRDDKLDFKLRRGLPLERVDGKRLKRTDPKTITISHCPFCGKEL